MDVASSLCVVTFYECGCVTDLWCSLSHTAAAVKAGIHKDLRYLIYFLYLAGKSFGFADAPTATSRPYMVVRFFAVVFTYIQRYWDKTITDDPTDAEHSPKRRYVPPSEFDGGTYGPAYQAYVNIGSTLLPAAADAEGKYLVRLFPQWAAGGVTGIFSHFYRNTPEVILGALRGLDAPAVPSDLCFAYSGPIPSASLPSPASHGVGGSSEAPTSAAATSAPAAFPN